MIKNDPNCSSFSGWLVVSEGNECDDIWDPIEGTTAPQIRYSINATSNLVKLSGSFADSSENLIADSMVIYVNAPNTSDLKITNSPTSVPTTVPAYFGADIYNYTVLLGVILNNAYYNATQIGNSVILKKNMITAFKIASVDVRHDLNDDKEIGVEIEYVTRYQLQADVNDNETISNRNTVILSSTAVSVSMLISFKTQSVFDRWYFDLQYVMIEFESNLKRIWNDSLSSNNNESFSVNLDYLINLETDTTTTTTTRVTNPSVVNTTMSMTSTSDTSTTLTSTNLTNKNNQTIDGNPSTSDKESGISAQLLDDYFNYTVIVLFGVFLVVTIIGWIDSKHFRHNELFKLSIMFIVFMYIMDVISDGFFVMQVLISAKENDTDEILIGFLSLLFIIIPIFTNFWQLHNEMKIWITDVDSKRVVQAWFRNHLRALYAISVICGSAFSAIEICNSNLFHLNLFNMGLNRRQKALFKNQRIFSTVMLEVKFDICVV